MQNRTIRILRGFDDYRQRSVNFSRRRSPSLFGANAKKTVNVYSTISKRAPLALP